MTLTLAIERDAQALATPRAHGAPALVFPLDGTIAHLHARTPVRLDRAVFALVPAGTRHRLETGSLGAIAVVTLVVGDAARALVARDYGEHYDDARMAEIVAALRVLPRTRWVDELVHRYVFEREVCEKHGSRAARFLETELVKELYFLGVEQLERRTRASVVFEGSAIATRARAWIEEHLFEAFATAELAKQLATSESTMLRAFRREVGVAPAIYLRRRRLEEALLLLETGRYAVTEVAARVGYDNPSAFAVAFRRVHGIAPSQARLRPAPGLLPAHGKPPQRRRKRRHN